MASCMTPEETIFFKETRSPVRLAAAAYASSDDFNRIPILDSSAEAKEIITKLLRKIGPVPNKEEFEADEELADWMLNIRVHIGIIPVEVPPATEAPGRAPPALAWDLAFVYRGTQPYSVTNWVTDFTFDQEPVSDYILQGADRRSQHGPILVHRGFHRAFKGVHPRGTDRATVASIAELKQRCGEATRDRHAPPHAHDFQARLTRALQDRPRRILSVGHSLGGALATLGAAWCKTTLCRDPAFRDCDVQCITLGSPRVGNAAFARAWDRLLRSREGNSGGEGKSYRIVNALDVVPSVPISIPFCEFQHVGMPVHLHRMVESWDVKVIPCLGQERAKPNTGSPHDHVQWHYTGAMVAAEATAASTSPAERRALCGQETWWVLSFAKQLKLSFMWDAFKRMLTLELSLPAHFWVLLLSWGAAVSFFLAGQAVCWLGLFPLITLLLPALSAAFVLDCVVTAMLLPFHLLFGSKQHRPRYKLGNFSLAVVSLVVMLISYVSAWLGL